MEKKKAVVVEEEKEVIKNVKDGGGDFGNNFDNFGSKDRKGSNFEEGDWGTNSFNSNPTDQFKQKEGGEGFLGEDGGFGDFETFGGEDEPNPPE